MLVDEAEAGARLELVRPGLQHGVGDDADLTAPLAHHVCVAVRAQVIHRGSVAEVDVRDETHLGEGVEEAVHRGDVHVGQLLVHPRGEVVGRHVVGPLEQHAQDGPALIGDPATLLSDRVQCQLDDVGPRHGVTLRQQGQCDAGRMCSEDRRTPSLLQAACSNVVT